VLLELALPVRHLVLAHNPAADCQYPALCGKAEERWRLSRYSLGPATRPKARGWTYPGILKSVEEYCAACGGNWWIRGLVDLVMSRGRMIRRRKQVGRQGPCPLWAQQLSASPVHARRLRRQWTDFALRPCLVDATGSGQAPRQPVSPATPALHRQCPRTPRSLFRGDKMLPASSTPPQLLHPAKTSTQAEMEANEGCKRRRGSPRPRAQGTPA